MTPNGRSHPRVLLLIPARAYRAADFLRAAAQMDLEVVIGSDGALPLGDRPVIHINQANPDHSASILATSCGPVDAVIAADAQMLELAAIVAARLGLPHNPAKAVRNAADKTRQRGRRIPRLACRPGIEVIGPAADALEILGCVIVSSG